MYYITYKIPGRGRFVEQYTYGIAAAVSFLLIKSTSKTLEYMKI